jgi:hypothetical protein
LRGLNESWKDFWVFGFWAGLQRRGAHVKTPKIGSRGAIFCFGGILGFYADLRREYYGGNLKSGFFGVLLSGPRGTIEEGGPTVFPLGHLGEFNVWMG